MRGAFKIGKLAGIEVFIHWTFGLLLLYVAFSARQEGADFQEIGLSLALVLAIFACVTLHELGHAMAARRYGIKTRDIVLLPIGGVARLENMPVNPWQEIVVAVAGPMVNVLIAIFLQVVLLIETGYFLWQLIDIKIFLTHFSLPLAITDSVSNTDNIVLISFLLFLTISNLVLIAFNALPAFPMDGGRVFRATLSFFMPRPNATQIAAAIGRLFAMAFGLYGIYIGYYWLILTALFVYWAASSEAAMVVQKARMEGLKVQNAMRTKYVTLYYYSSLQTAIDELLAGADTDFVICNDQHNVIGLLGNRDIIRALSEHYDKNLPLEPYIRTNIPVLMPQHPLHEVYTLMQENNYNLLPVIENGYLKGVIDLDNIAEFLLLREAAS